MQEELNTKEPSSEQIAEVCKENTGINVSSSPDTDTRSVEANRPRLRFRWIWTKHMPDDPFVNIIWQFTKQCHLSQEVIRQNKEPY